MAKKKKPSKRCPRLELIERIQCFQPADGNETIVVSMTSDQAATPQMMEFLQEVICGLGFPYVLVLPPGMSIQQLNATSKARLIKQWREEGIHA